MSLRITSTLLAVAATCAFATSINAAIISGSLSETIVESRSGGLNFAAYSEGTPGFPNSWSNSSAKSTAPGLTAGIGSRFNSNSGIGGADVWFQVAPTLPTAGGTYDLYVTVTGASGALSVTSTITATGGAGLPTTTTGFSTPGNEWHKVGTLTLNSGVNNPTVRFDETANNNRFYADAVLFAEMPAVPEPTAASLAAIAVCGLAIARRR
jgi:hypothetical protein